MRWVIWFLVFFLSLAVAMGVVAVGFGLWKRPFTAVPAIVTGGFVLWRFRSQPDITGTRAERTAFYSTIFAGILGEALNQLLQGPTGDSIVWQLVYVIGIGAPIGLGMGMGTWMLAEAVKLIRALTNAQSAT